MSSNFQQFMVIGNLGRDPEARTTNSGKNMVTFSVATKPAIGEETLWIDVAMFGKLATIAGQYLKKGAKVCLVGRLQAPRLWSKQDGTPMASLSMVANEMTMLGSATGALNGAQNGAAVRNGASHGIGTGPLEPVYDEGEEIPF